MAFVRIFALFAVLFASFGCGGGKDVDIPDKPVPPPTEPPKRYGG